MEPYFHFLPHTHVAVLKLTFCHWSDLLDQKIIYNIEYQDRTQNNYSRQTENLTQVMVVYLVSGIMYLCILASEKSFCFCFACF